MRWYPVTAPGLLAITDMIASQALGVLAPDITRALAVSAGAFASLLAVQLVAACLAPILMSTLAGGRAVRAVIAISTGSCGASASRPSGSSTACGRSACWSW